MEDILTLGNSIFQSYNKIVNYSDNPIALQKFASIWAFFQYENGWFIIDLVWFESTESSYFRFPLPSFMGDTYCVRAVLRHWRH